MEMPETPLIILYWQRATEIAVWLSVATSIMALNFGTVIDLTFVQLCFFLLSVASSVQAHSARERTGFSIAAYFISTVLTVLGFAGIMAVSYLPVHGDNKVASFAVYFGAIHQTLLCASIALVMGQVFSYMERPVTRPK